MAFLQRSAWLDSDGRLHTLAADWCRAIGNTHQAALLYEFAATAQNCSDSRSRALNDNALVCLQPPLDDLRFRSDSDGILAFLHAHRNFRCHGHLHAVVGYWHTAHGRWFEAAFHLDVASKSTCAVDHGDHYELFAAQCLAHGTSTAPSGDGVSNTTVTVAAPAPSHRQDSSSHDNGSRWDSAPSSSAAVNAPAVGLGQPSSPQVTASRCDGTPSGGTTGNTSAASFIQAPPPLPSNGESPRKRVRRRSRLQHSDTTRHKK